MENYESIDKALNISEPDVVPVKKESPKKDDRVKINEIEKDLSILVLIYTQSQKKVKKRSME